MCRNSRIRFWQSAHAIRIARTQFAAQVFKFVRDLSARDRDGHDISSTRQFAAIECIATRLRFHIHGAEIGIDRGARIPMRAKTLQSRMVLVARVSPRSTARARNASRHNATSPLASR